MQAVKPWRTHALAIQIVIVIVGPSKTFIIVIERFIAAALKMVFNYRIQAMTSSLTIDTGCKCILEGDEKIA